jgi:hypothetical protein
MPSIFAQSSDADINSGNVAYSSARSATTGTVATTTDTTAEAGIFRFGGRGGGNTVRIHRLFLRFNTSGISIAPSSATLKFTMHADPGVGGSANLIAVKSDAFTNSGQLQSSDFDNIDISTPYTAEIDTESSSANDRISVTLNSDALSDIAANDEFILALISHAHDFTNSEPAGTLSNSNTIRTADFSSTSSDPEIDYVEGVASSINSLNISSGRFTLSSGKFTI